MNKIISRKNTKQHIKSVNSDRINMQKKKKYHFNNLEIEKKINKEREG
jgi:hypothetical protein